MWFDENQLVQLETNNLMRVVHLCLTTVTEFSVSLASSHCVISLQDSTEHFPSTGTTIAICVGTLNLHYYHTRFFVPFPTLMIHYSQHFLPFSAM